MQVEFTGCTSGGKTTLIRSVVETCGLQGIAAIEAEEFVLGLARLNRVKAKTIRTLLIDLLTLSAALVAWRKHRAFCTFSLRTVARLQTGGFERLNLARNVLKKIGTYELIRCFNRNCSLILVDEGTVHAAHNLFVHLCREPDWSKVKEFTTLVPLPDVLVYVRAPESAIIARTLRRGHKRIHASTRQNVELFVRRALAVFSFLQEQPRLAARWLPAPPADLHVSSGARQTPDESVAALVEAVRGLRTAVAV